MKKILVHALLTTAIAMAVVFFIGGCSDIADLLDYINGIDNGDDPVGIDDGDNLVVYDYVCENGTPIDLKLIADPHTEPAYNLNKCADCDSGYYLVNDECIEDDRVVYDYVCENGTPIDLKLIADPHTEPAYNLNKCADCDSGYYLVNDECIEDDRFGRHPNGITITCPDIDVGESFNIEGKTYTKRTADQITVDNAADSCTSGITDMSNLFRIGANYRGSVSFNADISHWDTSSVTNMHRMFYGASAFNQDISSWDVSNVTDMSGLFSGTAFNQNISDWNVSSVTNMDDMFSVAESFNQNISGWDVSSVTSMAAMFSYATSFNQNIEGWIVTSVTNMRSMFSNASAFDQDIGRWEVPSVTDMRWMFWGASVFDRDLSGWCVSDIERTPQGFDTSTTANWTEAEKPKWGAPCGCDSDLWLDGKDGRCIAHDTLNGGYGVLDNGVTITCSGLNVGTSFTIDGITYTKRSRSQITASNAATTCTSGITDMFALFRYFPDSFNEDISHWDVSSVTDMSWMFHDATFFNQNIGIWNVSSVTDMSSMFRGATAFNQNIGRWNVSSVTDMSWMFHDATFFNQNIGIWNVSSVTDMSSMFRGATAFNQNIGGWNVSSVDDMGWMFHKARSFDQDISGWCVADIKKVPSKRFDDHTPASWQTTEKPKWRDSSVASCPPDTNTADTLPDSDPDDQLPDTDRPYGVLANGVTIVCHGIKVGASFKIDGITYTKRSKKQITTRNAATTCTSGITDMFALFRYFPDSFNEDISHWDVSSVTDMVWMFDGKTAFNQDISHWDVSSVTDMSSMFRGATAFNQNIGGWNVSSVDDMGWMFHKARSFDQDISGWCVADIKKVPKWRFDDSTSASWQATEKPKWRVSSVVSCTFS